MTNLKKVASTAAGVASAASTFALAQYVHAQALTQDQLFGGGNSTANDFAASAGLGSGNLTTTIASLIKTAMSFLGIVAVIIVLYGGFLWMTAAGNDDKVKQAKKVMISGVIGLAIVIAAFVLTTFVLNTLTSTIK